MPNIMPWEDVHGPKRVQIEDDGTLDFVMSYTCPDCGSRVFLRYDGGMRDYVEDLGLEAFAMAEWESLDGSECDCHIP
jgi:hypothetical protein